jgi:hypothetical protein
MNVDTIWVVGLGTVFSLALILGAAYFLRSFRNRFFPPSDRRDRGEALAELHLLQAEMKKKLDEGASDAPTREPTPASPTPEAASPPETPSQPTEPDDDEAKQRALEDLKALQAKMRKKLEEDRAREAAEGGGIPPDPDLEGDDLGP